MTMEESREALGKPLTLDKSKNKYSMLKIMRMTTSKVASDPQMHHNKEQRQLLSSSLIYLALTLLELGHLLSTPICSHLK